ncbi:hypothetical protein LAV73_22535 [Lysinibacillus xylanilyticus]|uniref:hypothetical protein n=1 Tax=Lysinibacillus xylanilyticus TaxID=582475 RepID=UPI002B246411|nr:hypothetical protein [Lysinibacillus xylanilyticus]MEB2282704.1 hypothetical protein [Lysinibacillus xylanilyticus]
MENSYYQKGRGFYSKGGYGYIYYTYDEDSNLVLDEKDIEGKNAQLNGQTYKFHRVYTKREPRILGCHDCKALLKKEPPDAEVSYC